MGDQPRRLLADCQLVNVYSGDIHRADVAIHGDRVVSIEPIADRRGYDVLDCAGLFAIPGLIDAHMHVDSTSLSPGELARVLVPLGTTSVVVDMSNIISTGGPDAVLGLMRSFEGLPLRAFFEAASYCPFDASRETTAYEMTARDFDAMLTLPDCVGMGETVYSKILDADHDYLGRIASCLSRGLRVSGHGGDGLKDNEAAFDAYVTAGVRDDHGVVGPNDVRPRLRRGVSLFTVESAGRENLTNCLVAHVRDELTPTRFVHFCVDNLSVSNMVGDGFGYLDHAVRAALAGGLPPVDVVRMASLNTAEHFRVADRVGGIAPGRLADILLTRRLDSFPPEIVLVGGEVVARNGTLTVDPPGHRFPESYQRSVRLRQRVTPSRLAMPAPAAAAAVRARVLRVSDQRPAQNTAQTAVLEVRDGQVRPDHAADVLKMCVAERYGRNGNIALAFASGFGLKRGAIATSVAVPANNIVAVGADDEDIAAAVTAVAELHGGYVVVLGGQVRAAVRLPLGGVMSEHPYESVVADLRQAERVVRDLLGGALTRPLNALTATGLPTLPDYGMTDRGLIDVAAGRVVPVLMGENE